MKENKFRVYCEIEFEGKITKSMESPASWFLMTQTGKLWTYDPGEAPRPLEKEYKKAIPLFYTGLKDKNGKEIYEGDIIEQTQRIYDNLKIKEHVFWDDSLVGFNPFADCDVILYGGMETVEIIGNIYENPELLSGARNERAKIKKNKKNALQSSLK